ncbi:MAG: hypothetical protein M3Y88_07065 [Chloroflexota bacterium]|nr:hypothetical protein [Chloroflexota bacterium]
MALALSLAGCGVPTATPPDTHSAAALRPRSPLQSARSANPTPYARLPAPALALRVELLAARLPYALSRAVAVADGGRVLVCGGLTVSGATTGAILSIDLDTMRIREVGRLAAPVHDAATASLGGAQLIFGGGGAVPEATVQRLEGNGSVVVGSLPAPRADLAAIAVGGAVVVAGGGTAAGADSRLLVTRDGARYRTLATLPVPVRYPAVGVIDGSLYVIGGATSTGDSDAIQRLDPVTGRVRVIGHLPVPISHAVALSIGGSLFVIGGRSGGTARDGIWRVEGASGRVAPAGRLPIALSDVAAVVVGGRAFLIGGEADGVLSSIVSLSPP